MAEALKKGKKMDGFLIHKSARKGRTKRRSERLSFANFVKISKVWLFHFRRNSSVTCHQNATPSAPPRAAAESREDQCRMKAPSERSSRSDSSPLASSAGQPTAIWYL
jgi:hypothetical protein